MVTFCGRHKWMTPNQSKNLIDSSKVFVLRFGTQIGARFRTRDTDLKTKKRDM